MKFIENTWKFLSGKKTVIGAIILFVYGGLSYSGYDMEWLQTLGMWVTGVGIGHKAVKIKNK